MRAIQSSRSNQVVRGNKLGCKALSVCAKCPLSFYHSTLLYDLDNNAQQTLLGVTQQPKGFAVQTAKGILQLYGYAHFARMFPARVLRSLARGKQYYMGKPKELGN